MTHEAIRNLLAQDDDEALDELRTLSTANDAFVRRTAIEVIGQHKRGHELRTIVAAALSDTSDYVRRSACGIVEQWKLAEVHDLVLPLLRAPEASTRECALRALGEIWHEADFQAILDLYRRYPEIRVRREAARTLRQGAAASNWRLLFDDFSRDALPRHRAWACELAEAFGGPDIVPILASLMDDDDGHVRKSAARARQATSSRN